MKAFELCVFQLFLVSAEQLVGTSSTKLQNPIAVNQKGDVLHAYCSANSILVYMAVIPLLNRYVCYVTWYLTAGSSLDKLSMLEIEYSDLEIMEKVGRGGSATVSKGRWISKNKIVAIKTIIELEEREVSVDWITDV